MYENLLKLVQEHAGYAILKNPAIPDSDRESAMKEIATGIAASLKQILAGGNLAAFFLSKNISAGPEVNQVMQHVAGRLMQKIGLSSAQANAASSAVVPKVLASLVGRTNDPTDNSFTMEGILNSLTGNNKGLGDKLGGLSGNN